MKTAKDLLKWIESWTPEQKKDYAELADDIEKASKEFRKNFKLRDVEL